MVLIVREASIPCLAGTRAESWDKGLPDSERAPGAVSICGVKVDANQSYEGRGHSPIPAPLPPALGGFQPDPPAFRRDGSVGNPTLLLRAARPGASIQPVRTHPCLRW